VEKNDMGDIQKLRQAVNDFKAASLSENTRKAYRSDWNSFLDFCEYQNLSPMPASVDTLELYLTELATQGRTYSTIVRALTSINKAHGIMGEPDLRTISVRTLLEGIRKKCAGDTRQSRGLVYRELTKMISQCDQTVIGARDRALLWVGWCSSLRRSELVSLNLGDLDWEPEGVRLRIRRSKTDQAGKGRWIGIPYSADTSACPVTALRDWIGRLPAPLQKPRSPLFRSIGMGGRKKWFVSDLGGRLSGRSVALIVKKYAHRIGLNLPGEYAAHSLRRGLATEAAARNVPERFIARQTGHRSLTVLREYIEEGSVWRENPLNSIYLTTLRSSPDDGPIGGP
jgi:site-specific recombinase XerD